MFGRKSILMTTRAGRLRALRLRRGLRRRRQAGGRLRPRRQVRQILQRRRLQRRDQVHQGHRHRVPRPRDPERRAARAGAAQVRQGRLFADHDGRLRLGDRARQDRRRVPEDQVRHHRHGRRQAQRAVDRVQGAGRLVPGRRASPPDVEDRQGRLRRRHGHSADLEVRVRLRPGRQIRIRRQGRGVRQHDRHDAGRLERSGQGRRTRQVADRPRRRHRLRRRRLDRTGRAEGGRRRRQARHRRRLRTRTTCFPARS